MPLFYFEYGTQIWGIPQNHGCALPFKWQKLSQTTQNRGGTMKN